MSVTEPEDNATDENGGDPWDASAAESVLAPPTPSWKKTLRFVALLSVAVVLAIIGVQQLTSKVLDDQLTADALTDSPSNRDSVGDREVTTPIDAAPANVISTSEAASRAKVLQAQANIQTTQELLGRLTEQQQRWDDKVTSVTTGKLGQQVAANQGAVELFAGLQQRERLSPVETSGLRDSLIALAKPIEMAAADDTATLNMDEGFETQLAEIRKQLELGLKQWQEDNAMLRLLINEAQSREPAAVTLGEAIEDLRAKQLRERADKIAAEVKANAEALTQQEAASKIELQELESQKRLEQDKVEAERKREELAGLKAEQIALADQIAAAREKAKLEREFQAELPEIKSVLVPFLASGHKQIVNGKWTYLEEKQPLSLSGLKSLAVLEGDQMSFQRLFFAAGGRKNDRPSGPFPTTSVATFTTIRCRWPARRNDC